MIIINHAKAQNALDTLMQKAPAMTPAQLAKAELINAHFIHEVSKFVEECNL